MHGQPMQRHPGQAARRYSWISPAGAENLIRAGHRPRTRIYRSIWRNHRLHHYRNEHYWFTVTTSGTADRILGTYADPQTVPPSPTAKALHST